MRDVLIALVPALILSVVFFGFRALTVTLVSMAACVFFEWAWCKCRKINSKIYDLSAVVTGVLLAFVCPPTIPYWMIILGDLFAIILVKMLFGGIGKNIVNPALAGRAFMFSWPVAMSTWVKVGFANAPGLLSTADAVTAATPLAAMHQGYIDPTAGTIKDMFLGNVGGCIGETSALLLLIGFTMVMSSVSVILQRYYYKLTRKIFGEPRRLFKMSPIHHHCQKKGYSETRIAYGYFLLTLFLGGICIWIGV